MKKILISLAIIGVVAGVTLGITGAWWSDSATSHNASFHSGTLDLRLANAYDNSQLGNAVNNTWDQSNMEPGGTPLEKTLYMKNVGSVDAHRMGFSVTGISGTSGSITPMAQHMRITKLEYGLHGETLNNLLKGGAGAVIPDYVAPTKCDVTVDPSVSNLDTIHEGIAVANSGDVVCVKPGNYHVGWKDTAFPITINKDITLVSLEGPAKTTITASANKNVIEIDYDDVTIKGFTITNGNLAGTGIYSADHSHLTIANNIITAIGNSIDNVVGRGIIVVSSSSAVDGISITDNKINDITSGLRTGTGSTSASGISIGWTSGDKSIKNLLIQNNIISNINANTSPWNTSTKGQGAYGILINHGTAGGQTQGAQVLDNTIDDIEGLWAHGIGLEGATPNAVVTGNIISNLTDHKYPSDAIAVYLEDNPNGSTVTINKNNLGTNVSWGVGMASTASGNVNAQNNWWGDFNPSDQVFVLNSGSIDTTNYAGGPFNGYVNGVDSDSNGFADIYDFYAQRGSGGIDHVTPGLAHSQWGELDMAVQLDGPTTDNSFQGKTLGMDMMVNMYQH